MNRFTKLSSPVLIVLLAGGLGLAKAEESTFYKNTPLFSTAPDPTKSLQSIDRFGPVGIGIELIHPVFTMRVKNVEEGSPAAATGKLKPGQIIETINGETLKDIDPRIQLGRILAKAEATDGVIKLSIKGESDPVTVKIPVLGAYSETWPLNCTKSDKIVRQAADYIAGGKGRDHYGLGNIGMLFLLSTGEGKDLEVVRQWARTEPAHSYAWYLGYGGIPLTECYLRTGDPVILENIQKWVDSAVEGQYLDAWPGRNGTLTDYGGGHLNAAGTSVLTFLLLAKECGAEVPDHALLGALRHFYRYAGRGNNPYGDDRPYTGFVDNGKNGLLAFSMAAAANLTPDGENSVYARARDICAMKGFYLTTYMLHGHTGGGIGEIWRSAAMGLLHETKPAQYREFMDKRQWHYDLSRRHDGSFGILGGGGYDKEQWGVAFPLAYTMPRKTLRVAGAPPSKFSKSYQLPEQPWGNDADDAFMTMQSVPDQDGKLQDVSGETLARDSAKHFLRRFQGEPQSDDEIRRYIRHPEFNIRNIAACKAIGLNPGYYGQRGAGGEVRRALVMEFLQHDDPRVRRAMFAALLDRGDALTPEIHELAAKAVADPDESWMVKDAALLLIGRGSADQIVPHVDVVIPYLKHQEEWLQNAALTALAPVVADERCYKRVVPAIGELLQTNQRGSVTVGLTAPIRSRLKEAAPEVQELAKGILRESFTGYAGKKVTVNGHDISRTYDWHLEGIASSLINVPGGYDVLYEIARERYPDEILPYKELFLAAESSQFGPKLKKAITPIIMDELVPEYVGKNRRRLLPLAASETSSGWPGNDTLDGLAALYKRAGHDEYDWKMFADLRDAEWSYHSFDPIASEQVPFDQLVMRYREVTLPKGMENWHAATFDPAKAGWQNGKSPFGNYDGKIPDRPITKCNDGCVGPGSNCYGATKVNTLFEKEALLLRGTFKVPALKDGHRYRLRVNSGDHVGAGGGHLIFINGRQLIEAVQGGGRGSGGRPKGAYITKEFFDDFQGGEVTIAVKTFIRYGSKYAYPPKTKTPQGKFSLHFEEQKLPPMGDDLVFRSAKLVPMMSSDWQAKLDPEDNSQNPDDNLFRWDGNFVANPKVQGSWQLLGQVVEIADFDPEKRLENRNAPFKAITLNNGGGTSEATWAWSGDTLMDLDKFQALKMQVRTIGGSEYLFAEEGNFSTRHKPGWKPKWHVMKAK